jgi:hypothetical protein
VARFESHSGKSVGSELDSHSVSVLGVQTVDGNDLAPLFVLST